MQYMAQVIVRCNMDLCGALDGAVCRNLTIGKGALVERREQVAIAHRSRIEADILRFQRASKRQPGE